MQNKIPVDSIRQFEKMDVCKLSYALHLAGVYSSCLIALHRHLDSSVAVVQDCLFITVLALKISCHKHKQQSSLQLIFKAKTVINKYEKLHTDN